MVPGLPMTHIDANYPDYSNAIQRAGIGEHGVDLGPSPPVLHDPDTPEIMSYCGGPRWISPYNYLRAFSGPMLHGAQRSATFQAEAQKLLVAFRVHRDGKVKFKWALHLPGEPPQYPAKTPTNNVLELYDTEGVLLASADCHRASDQPDNAPCHDFQEVIPWFDSAAYRVACP